MKELLAKLRANIKIVIAALAALVVIICAVVVITQVVGSKSAQNTVTAVYKREGKSVVRIAGQELVIDDTTADDFACDKEHGRVFYRVNSASSDSLYDLCYVELKKGEITAPRIIDYGVEKDYGVSNGKVYYRKFNRSIGADDGCVCDPGDKKISTFAENVSTVYTLDGASEIYFIKMHGDTRVLYRFDGEQPTEAARNVVGVYTYNGVDKPHIIFEKKSQTVNGATEIYIAEAGGQPALICDNAVSVMYDNYRPGGNLYYFTSSDESVSWSYVISDNYEESDKSVTRPRRTDFFSFFGVSADYNKALREYQDKLIRDEIRAALNECVANGDFSVPAFTAFAYTPNGVLKVADDVDPTRVYSVAANGEPKIIFESMKVLSGETAMDTLVDIAQRSNMSEVIKYAKSIVTDSVVSDGMTVAANIGGSPVSHPLAGYDKSKTLFSFSEDGSRIFALVRDNAGERLSLFTNSIDPSGAPSSEVGVDTGISSYRFTEDSVVYLKSDIGKGTGDVFAYNVEKSVKLANAANAFQLEKGDNIVILKNYDSNASDPTADLYVYEDGKEKQVASNVSTDSLICSQDGVLGYISVDDSGSRSFGIYGGSEAVTASSGVSEILLLV